MTPWDENLKGELLYDYLEQWWGSDEWKIEQLLGWYDITSPFADEIAMAAAADLNYDPLAARLCSGRAAPELLQWVADGIKSGYFNRRSSTSEKLKSPIQRAARDVPDIARLLGYMFPRVPARELHDKALSLAADRHGTNIEAIANLLKRGTKDRRRRI